MKATRSNLVGMKSLALLTTTTVIALLLPPGLVADTNVQLRVLETTDIHVHIVDYDYYQDAPSVSVGLARTATLIRAARDEVRNSILVDNGDILQGNPLGDFIARQRGLEDEDVHPVYKAMNLLGYSVANLGNHDFNYGLEFLAESIDDANFPYISANVFHEDGDDDTCNDKPYFEQYVILDKTLTADNGSEHDIRIGLVGFVPPQIMKWDSSNLRGRVVTHDIIDTARRLVPKMKAEGADIVIAIPHSGISSSDREGMDEQATYYLSTVPDIDAILFGHNHLVFPSDTFAAIPGVDVEKGTINGVPSVMPGAWGSHLGFVDLQLRVSSLGDWTVTDGVGVVRPIMNREGEDTIALVEPAADILAAVNEDHEATIEFVRTSVGKIMAPIHSFFALVRDDPSVQVVTNAQKRYIERLIRDTELEGLPVLSASAPFKAGGRRNVANYTEIEAGPIALRDVANLYIYPNTVRAVAISGAEVREWLEMSAGIFNQIDPEDPADQELINPGFSSFNFDVIDGIDYRIDITQPRRYDDDGKLINADSHRIVDLRFDGKPVDVDQQFLVATNNYRAGGGGSFPGMDGSNIVIEAPDTNRSVLADYIFEQRTLNPSADNNWSFAPVTGEVNVTFLSSPDAARYLDPRSPIELIGVNQDGFGEYRIHLGIRND